MKLIILILICNTVLGAIFEQGYAASGQISAHQIYRQDIKLNNNFAEIPKIVLSVIGYQSNQNTLDFFSRVTDVTKEGFQLQVISDSEINEIRFNYLATDHKDVQTICNNLEVQKDQIDMKFNTEFEELPQVAAFLTGIHRQNQDDIILEIKSIEKNQVHLATQSKAESSLGLCLLIGPQNVFNRKELPIMQISQGLPNNSFYGISSLAGVADNGILLNLNQMQVENSFKIGLTLIEIDPGQITNQEVIQDNNTVSFDDLVDKQMPQEQPEQIDFFEQEGQININSIQITQEELEFESKINSISFIYPEQQDQLYIEVEEQNLQQIKDNTQEIMTISESWLQHDLSVVDQSQESQASLDNNQVQFNEGQQLLTNLIKPQDFNTNSIEYEDFESFKRQAENIVIVDCTQVIIEENQKKSQSNQDSTSEISIDSTQDYDLQNQIEQQIDLAEEQIVVDDLQEQMMEMQEEMQNLQQNSQSRVSSELDPFKIIEQQQFIVEQQKQLVDQQQQIIQQYQKLFEDKVKILSDQQPNNEFDEKQVEKEQNTNEDQLETLFQSNLNINDNQNQLTNQEEQNQKLPQNQDQLQQNVLDQKYVLQDFPSQNLENKSNLKKDLESFDKIKIRKDEIDEQKATQILKEITKDLLNDEKMEDKINQIEDSLNEVFQIKSQNEVQQNLNDDISSIPQNKRVEFSNIKNNLDNITTLNFQDISNQAENVSLEEISQAIFPQEYEIEQAYYDWSMNQGFMKNRNELQINQELIQQSNMSNQQSQEELQKQIEEFLELDYNESHFSDPLFDDFHSFFSVNQQVKKNLRKRKVLNV
ncbi:unnamed protein product [Paramecium sonneborni]|uniref:H-type lectin domain-containing protein n=1 Tax=Paramecium sonneborni TaxID=65129 RepID=A0A8S1M1E9_9CILI|nr:unnamed protein product [Paramecium sonneborni]